MSSQQVTAMLSQEGQCNHSSAGGASSLEKGLPLAIALATYIAAVATATAAATTATAAAAATTT